MDFEIVTVKNEALFSTLSEEKTTIEDVHEPFLLKEGYILRTPRGRELGEKGWSLLGGNEDIKNFVLKS